MSLLYKVGQYRLQFDSGVVSSGRPQTWISRTPGHSIAPWAMCIKFLHEVAASHVPDEDATVFHVKSVSHGRMHRNGAEVQLLTFGAANDKTLVCTTKVASYSIITTDMARILLYRSSSSDVDELSHSVLLVYQKILGVLREAYRRCATRQLQVVSQLPGWAVINVETMLVVHSNQPSAIRGDCQVLNSGLFGPGVKLFTLDAPCTQGVILVESTQYERLPIRNPDTAADWFTQFLKLFDKGARLRDKCQLLLGKGFQRIKVMVWGSSLTLRSQMLAHLFLPQETSMVSSGLHARLPTPFSF